MSDGITRIDKAAVVIYMAITIIIAALSAYYLGTLMRALMG